MAYADDVAVSEAARQQAHKAASTDAAHVAADLAHFARVVAAGRTWGVRNQAQMQALIRTGQTTMIAGGAFKPGDQ